jgi:hypothetical protein
MKVRNYSLCGFVFRDRAHPIPLHARSQLFMTILIGCDTLSVTVEAIVFYNASIV